MKFNWSSGGASGLFDLYVSEGMPEKALALANKLSSKEDWKNQVTARHSAREIEKAESRNENMLKRCS